MGGMADIFRKTYGDMPKAQTRMAKQFAAAPEAMKAETPMNISAGLDLATNIPVAGDVLSGVLALRDAAKGEWGSAGMNALGVLPFVSAGMIKGAGKAADALGGKKLTEFEQRHLTAQKNAALPIEQGGLGLPVNNTSMDRARAMGAVDAYHGSRHPEGVVKDGFIPGGANGASRSGDAYGVGVYTTSSPSEASSLTYTGENGAVFPLMVMRDNHLPVDNPSGNQLEKLTQFAQDSLLPSDKARFPVGRETRYFDLDADAEDFYRNQKANWQQFGDGMHRAKPKADFLKDGGVNVEFTNFDAPVKINNGEDASTLLSAVGWDSVPSMGFSGHTLNRQSGNVWDVTTDTSKLRSRFAAFDPMRRHEADLLGRIDPSLLAALGFGSAGAAISAPYMLGGDK